MLSTSEIQARFASAASRQTIDQASIEVFIGQRITVFYVGSASVMEVVEINKAGTVITVASIWNKSYVKRFRRPKEGRGYWSGVASDRGLLAKVGVEQPQELCD
jgi:hypothetical protein